MYLIEYRNIGNIFVGIITENFPEFEKEMPSREEQKRTPPAYYNYNVNYIE